MSSSYDYDIIICGAGCAGLSLAFRLAEEEFKHLRILLIDRDQKNNNDRTWCSWQKVDHYYFPTIHHARWPALRFEGPIKSINLSLQDYQYCMIRGIDFYEHCLNKIAAWPNVELIIEPILSIEDQGDYGVVHTDQGSYRAPRVYDSIVKKHPVSDKLFVWQHFKGWEIEVNRDCFDPNIATLMDFRIEQHDETRFMYVLPLSERKAFVEATIYSTDIPDQAYYDDILIDYLKRFIGLTDYQITAAEVGAIPMTTTFYQPWSEHVIPIGTNAATVKPSSGYAFIRIQEESEELIRQIRNNENYPVPKKKRFIAYDRTLLNVLLTKKEAASDLFEEMFDKNSAATVFKFLDEKTSLWEELKLFSSFPFFSFLRAFIAENVFNLTKNQVNNS